MGLEEEGRIAIREKPHISFREWEKLIKKGAIGVQDGNMSQRWAYREGYFVELREYEQYKQYADGNGYADSPSKLQQRFYRNLDTANRGLVILNSILIGGE